MDKLNKLADKLERSAEKLVDKIEDSLENAQDPPVVPMSTGISNTVLLFVIFRN